jgi:cysteine desulfuration protein SufE
MSDGTGLEPRQREIVEEFGYFGDWSERYQYLIDLGRKLPPLPAEGMTDPYKVSGCQSQVGIVPHGGRDELRFDAISDSAIVSGLIALLLRVYSARPAAEIAATEPAFVDALGLQSHLSPTRSNGLHAMLRTIKRYAAEAARGARFD